MIKERFYCLNCFKDFEIDMTEICEAVNKMDEFKNSSYSSIYINVECQHCNTNACFNVDEKMIPVIRFMNELGYETFAHCSGHLTRNPFHFKSTESYSAYLGMYISKEEKEIIKQIPANPCLDVTFSKEMIDDDLIRDRVVIYYVPELTSEEKINEAIETIFKYVSQFPKSDSFEKDSFVDAIMEED